MNVKTRLAHDLPDYFLMLDVKKSEMNGTTQPVFTPKFRRELVECL